MFLCEPCYSINMSSFCPVGYIPSTSFTSTMSADCVVCKTTVCERQESIECDNPSCKRWTHRTCGTGISRQEYRQANKTGSPIAYLCELCRQVSTAIVQPDLRNLLQPLESTRASLATSVLREETLGSSIRQELGEFSVQFNLSENASENFDITRPERSLEMEENEESLDDETIVDEDLRDIESQVTYEVIETGSKRGKRKLVSSDGYTFVHKRTQKNGTVVWRCSVRGKRACPANVNECSGDYQRNNSSHIHCAKPGIDVAVKIFADVKELARTDHFETAGTTTKQVIDKYLDEQLELPEASRPVESTLGRICRQARSATRPKDPADLSFELNTDYIASTTDASFLREDIRVDSQQHLLFATDQQLNLLSNTKTWYLDDTFKIIKRPFVQLLSIHGFVRSGEDMKQLPLCFIIMSRRQKKDYKKPVYSKKDRVFKLLRQVFALPFLPSDDIPTAFKKLQDKALKVIQDSSTTSKVARDLQEYFDYVEDTWIESGTWPVSMLSVFGRSIRTNNDCEGWHNRLNQRAKKGNLPFYLTIDLLYSEAIEIPTHVKMISEGKLQRRQQKRTRETTGKLMELWEQYSGKEITASRLLKEAAKLYAPV